MINMLVYAAPVEGKNKHWWIVFSIALAFLWGIACIIYTVSTGIGTWGLNKTVGWVGYHKLRLVGWYRSRWNFNFCGITLFRQRWRMAINRSAEAMTIFSVIQAGLFHTHGASMVGVWVCLYRINLVLCG
jgi:molybdopterin-containing oxidoreductase family membrane subunit